MPRLLRASLPMFRGAFALGSCPLDSSSTPAAVAGRCFLPTEHMAMARDARAARLGLSRSEYLRRRLAQELASTAESVSVEHLDAFAQTFADLADPKQMKGAWE